MKTTIRTRVGLGLAVIAAAGVVAYVHHARKSPMRAAAAELAAATVAAPQVAEETPTPPAATSGARDQELGRIAVARGAAPGAKAPSVEAWEAHGTPVALPHASRCLAAVLDGFMRLQCESRRGAGFGVAVLAGGREGVAVKPSPKGVTEVVFPMREGDRRFFQLDEVETTETGRGYEGDGIDTQVVPAVNVSVVWFAGEQGPRVVVREA
jgi:hypothetical protein